MYEKPVDRLKESLHLFGKKYHKEFYALNNVSFSLEKGQAVGIIGKNGSGKSTLLKIITGIMSPSSGEINVKGKVSALLELGAGFNPEYTGIENIYLNGLIMGFTREEMDAKLDEIMNFAEIGEFIYRPVKSYSSGMFARLAFAVAINVEPEILIVDETLSVGDVRFQAKCMNRFQKLKESGVTILFVSHDVFAIRNYCDQAIWLHEGVVKEIGDTKEITARYVEFMNTGHLSEPKATPVHEVVQERRTVEGIEFSDSPINRWGSRVGLIKGVALFDQHMRTTKVIETGEKSTIKMMLNVPADIDVTNLSIAFSIKNALGVDLIVSTMFDSEDVRITKGNCDVMVEFQFMNYLNKGDYILVAALEDRSQRSPEYYDYIEGALYFKVTSDNLLFGLFNPPVEKRLTYLEPEKLLEV